MKRFLLPALLSLSAALGASSLPAQAQRSGTPVFVPESSVELPGDVGLRAHTNHRLALVAPEGGLGPNGGMSPAQIRAFYNVPASGGGGIIAIVDAYNYPSALNDFNVFARQFGLPTEPSTSATASTNQVFQVVYANGGKPRNNGSWSQEMALDIEWAHAMSPAAKIVLVEAASNSFSNLFHAIDVASGIAGVKDISMSWGGSEFSTEASYDSHFPQGNGVVYFAASGDTGGATIYPSASPYVVGAGGTSVATDSTGAFSGETGWSGSGGGRSLYEPAPAYQSVIAPIVGNSRGIPDIASDADPNTGVSVYDSTSYQGFNGWMVFGGTSVATPTIAGIVNEVHGAAGVADTNTELTHIYSAYSSNSTYNYFRDIVSGSAGSNSCTTGWDYVTGVGTSLGSGGL